MVNLAGQYQQAKVAFIQHPPPGETQAKKFATGKPLPEVIMVHGGIHIVPKVVITIYPGPQVQGTRNATLIPPTGIRAYAARICIAPKKIRMTRIKKRRFIDLKR